MLAPVRQLVEVVLRPFQFLVYWLSGLVPRDPSRWAFGTWAGHRYADNAAALFEHLAEHPADGITTTWITRRRSIRDTLRAEGHRAELAWSPAGIWTTLRSGVHIYDSLPKDVNYWLSRRATLVLLRHGIGVKQIERGIDAPDHRLYKLFHGTPWQRLFYGVMLPSHRPIPDLVLACSEEHAQQGLRYFGVQRDAVHITGFPRHDRLAVVPPIDRQSVPCIGAPVPADRPLFLFLPTFREGLGRFRYDWKAIASAAAAAGVTVGVKLHYIDAQRGVVGMDEIKRSPQLRLVDPTVDPGDWYPHADGLITDFSSAAFDFLLLRRPIIYFVPDLDDFRASRPLTLQLEEVAAGPICQTAEELKVALTEAASKSDHQTHDQLVERFYAFPPGGASERVTAAILSKVRADAEH